MTRTKIEEIQGNVRNKVFEHWLYLLTLRPMFLLNSRIDRKISPFFLYEDVQDPITGKTRVVREEIDVRGDVSREYKTIVPFRPREKESRAAIGWLMIPAKGIDERKNPT